MSTDPVLAKYLAKYAEPTAAWAAELVTESYESVYVVPAFDEHLDFLAQGNIGASTRRLLVVVVNAPPSAPQRAHHRNEQLVRDLVARARSERQHPRAPLRMLSEVSFEAGRLSVLLIDATQESYCLAEKEGVGRARKMGADAACALFAGRRTSSPFVGFGDADCQLTAAQFEALERPWSEQPAALLYPFEHTSCGEHAIDRAMRLLQLSFLLYVVGLHRAGSPYAYHCLGSAMAVSVPHYAAVRGVPNRQAGEDFHLLAKLAKLAPLRRLELPVVRIGTRLSERVPFGTGPSLARALERAQGPTTYDPAIYDRLGQVLHLLSISTLAGAPQWTTQLPAWLQKELTHLWSRLAPELHGCPTATHRLQRMHEQLDALGTLQLVHRLERSGFSKVTVEKAARSLFQLPGPPWFSDEQTFAAHSAEIERFYSSLPALVGPHALPTFQALPPGGL